jgi:Holliday junction resolvasome RuvABC endonuclease subunit
MKVLGLDPSLTATGWALIGDKQKLFSSGTIRSDTVGEFATSFASLVAVTDPQVIVYEQARRDIAVFGKKGLMPGMTGFVTPNANQLVLLEVQGVILGVAASRSIRALPVSVATWRACMYGKGGGRLGRDEAKAKAKETCRQMKLPFKSVDEAEAIMVGLYGAALPEVRHGLLL